MPVIVAVLFIASLASSSWPELLAVHSSLLIYTMLIYTMRIYIMRIYTMRIYTIHSPTALPAILQHDRRSLGKYNTPPANPEIQPCQPPDLPIRAHLSSSSEPDNRPSPSMYPPFPHLRNPTENSEQKIRARGSLPRALNRWSTLTENQSQRPNPAHGRDPVVGSRPQKGNGAAGSAPEAKRLLRE